MAHLPLLDRVAPRIEDGLDWIRLAGTPTRRNAIQRKLAACHTTQDYLAFIRPVLPFTQIDLEIGSLLQLATERRVKRVLEIGTAQGGTTFLLSRAIPSTEWMLTIDLLPRHSSVLRFLNAPKCTFHALGGSSIDPRILSRVAARLGSEKVDLLFIDGDHSYEGVKADFQLYCPWVRPGGLVVFHDIVPAAETGAPTAGHRWVGGVPRFWNEIKPQGARSWEFVGSWTQGGFGIGVIEIGGDASGRP
ncbi:MAG TPA: class I SAM-dependent methyltransferase [Opitutaceae bacterium]|nr:class I SAM-dependent methyltransferase [Opitutaceae bacterium]